jgi:N-acetylneuraminate synthase
LPEEQPVIDFAYASVVAIAPINAGETFSLGNIWVKRPGIGEIHAEQFNSLLGRTAKIDIKKDQQLTWEMVW